MAAPTQPTLLIVHHSRTGGAEQMARAAQRGAARAAGLQVRYLRAQETGPDDLLTAQGYLFALPENLAAISGAMKEFFDRCYYPVQGRLNGRPYALLVCAGSDGSNAVRQTERIATGWRLRKVAESLIVCTQAQTAEPSSRPRRLRKPTCKPARKLARHWAMGWSWVCSKRAQPRQPCKDSYTSRAARVCVMHSAASRSESPAHRASTISPCSSCA